MAHRPSTAFSRPAHQPALARDQRRATGVYYTAPEIVRRIVELTLAPLLQGSRSPLRILDPACGAGEFLVEVQQFLANANGAMANRGVLCGVDIDPAAIATSRTRLNEAGCKATAHHLLVGDALAESALQCDSFDAILGNPPYVNIRQLAKAMSRARIDELREKYQTARGNFDLYVLFIERALALLRPGGRCGLIIPNKWATLDYARACRELLLKRATIEQVIDLSDVRAFAQASVYPQILVFRKQRPAANHAVAFHIWPRSRRSVSTLACSESGTNGDACSTVPQQSLVPEAFAFQSALDVESRVPTQPLGALATLSCGTAGFSAQRIAGELCDVGDVRNVPAGVPSRGKMADFITSGNIDRYVIRLGNVRYLNRTYAQPRLRFDSAELTPAKQRLFASPKIVIAGMSQRLEAAWDDRGLALGVQVFAASDCRVDPFYLLALLNSKLLSYLFATRFAAKRLAGGYLAINKGQLARLPIVTLSHPIAGIKPGPGPGLQADSNAVHRLATLAGRMFIRPTEPIETEIDHLVYAIYRLSNAEIARIERHFAHRSRAAA